MRHGVRRRGGAVAIVFIGALALIAAIGATFVPTLINEVNDFAAAVPGYVDDLTKGRGPLGFLERDYQIVERIRDAIEKSGVGGVLGLSSTAVGVAKGVVTAVVAILTIAFLTLFMLLEGPNWVERVYGLVPERHETRVRRIGEEVYRAIGGYVAGNLVISFVAGAATAIVLHDTGVSRSPSRSALIVAILDLGAARGRDDCRGDRHDRGRSSTRPLSGIVVLIFFVLYQQFENHVLQPVVYGGRPYGSRRSPCSFAVLIGAELAGVVGALGAIPAAAAVQVVLHEFLGRNEAEVLPLSLPPTRREARSPAITASTAARGRRQTGRAATRALP